jgi:hypothetical protein
LEIGPSFCLPPVESCRGTSPIQAAKSRPEQKTIGVRHRRGNRVRPDNSNARNGLKPPANLVDAMLLHDPLIKRRSIVCGTLHRMTFVMSKSGPNSVDRKKSNLGSGKMSAMLQIRSFMARHKRDDARP